MMTKTAVTCFGMTLHMYIYIHCITMFKWRNENEFLWGYRNSMFDIRPVTHSYEKYKHQNLLGNYAFVPTTIFVTAFKPYFLWRFCGTMSSDLDHLAGQIYDIYVQHFGGIDINLFHSSKFHLADQTKSFTRMNNITNKNSTKARASRMKGGNYEENVILNCDIVEHYDFILRVSLATITWQADQQTAASWQGCTFWELDLTSVTTLEARPTASAVEETDRRFPGNIPKWQNKIHNACLNWIQTAYGLPQTLGFFYL